MDLYFLINISVVRKSSLVEEGEIISNDGAIAETFNTYFANIVKTLDIEGFAVNNYVNDPKLDYISNIVQKFSTHASIVKIKEHVKIAEPFNLKPVYETIIKDKIVSIDIRKPTNYLQQYSNKNFS